MRCVVFLFVGAGLMTAQQPEALLNDVETAILSRDLGAAYDAAARLDDTVQAAARQALRASQTRDLGPIANQVLTWVPPDWPAFVLDQRAFVIGERTPRLDVALLTDRLYRLSGGAFLNGLRGATVRASAVGSNARAAQPALAYFYFFERNVNPGPLGNPELFILGRPFWSGGEGDYSITLARPDVLIVASSRDLAAAMLGRVLNGSSTRALPPALAEWGEVDRDAPLWALRHVSGSGEFNVGMTVSLDASQKLEVRCQCVSRPTLPEPEFEAEHPRNGLWVLRSNLAQRGEGPMKQAFSLLGLGDLR